MGSRPKKRPGDRSVYAPGRRPRQQGVQAVGVRIIGGRFRGRKLQYSGDPRTRPMKDRVREALFNLLGPSVKGKFVVDLFAGTGAIGLEALSRGALAAILIEQHLPTARDIRRSVETLGVAEAVQIVTADAFLWFPRHRPLAAEPWLVFCSPPYEFYSRRAEAMLDLLGGMIEAAPRESIFSVEADERFDFGRLPYPEAWDVRAYPPAQIGLYEKD